MKHVTLVLLLSVSMLSLLASSADIDETEHTAETFLTREKRQISNLIEQARRQQNRARANNGRRQKNGKRRANRRNNRGQQQNCVSTTTNCSNGKCRTLCLDAQGNRISNNRRQNNRRNNRRNKNNNNCIPVRRCINGQCTNECSNSNVGIGDLFNNDSNGRLNNLQRQANQQNCAQTRQQCFNGVCEVVCLDSNGNVIRDNNRINNRNNRPVNNRRNNGFNSGTNNVFNNGFNNEFRNPFVTTPPPEGTEALDRLFGNNGSGGLLSGILGPEASRELRQRIREQQREQAAQQAAEEAAAAEAEANGEADPTTK